MIPTQPLLEDFARAASEKRTNPGVIVLTPQGQLLYMNREATELCAEINQSRLGQVARGILPTEVINLCHAITQQITAVQDVKAWEGAHVRLLIADLAPPMLLRGFGIPGPSEVDQARVFIMLDRIAPREPVAMSQVCARFGLTPRGRAVVRCLVLGHTNKEMAQRLRITEQTVKEHVQRLMRKTKTSTRTGLLARLLLKSNSAGVIGSVLASF
jgi:DNA-binding CsgD family transcriptional regulator